MNLRDTTKAIITLVGAGVLYFIVTLVIGAILGAGALATRAITN